MSSRNAGSIAAARVYGVIVTGMLAVGAAFYFLGIAPLAANHRNVHLDGVNGVFSAALDQINMQVAGYTNTARQVGSRSAIRNRQIAFARGTISAQALVDFAQPKLAEALSASVALVGVTRFGPDGAALMTAGYGAEPNVFPPCPPMRAPGAMDIAVRVIAGQAYLRFCAALDDRAGNVIGHDELVFGLSSIASQTIRHSDLTVRYRLALANAHSLSGVDGIVPLSLGDQAFAVGHLRHYDKASETLLIARPTAIPGLWLKASVDLTAFQATLSAYHTQLYLAVGLALVVATGLTLMVVNPLIQKAMGVEAAEQKAEARATFLKTMSHELRTPINGVLGMADLLAHQDLSEKQKTMVSTIKQSGLDLLTMVTAVLDTNKIGTGALVLARKKFDVAAMVRDVVSVHAATAHRHGLHVDLAMDGPMNQRIGDRHRVAQILNNLLSNAIKFSAHGTIGLDVDTSRADRLVFCVSDEGAGMSPEKAATIFEPFVQLDVSDTRQYGGAGLGLTIVHGIVEAMGGAIKVDTALGEGTRLTVTLPLPASAEEGDAREGGYVVGASTVLQFASRSR